LPPSVKDLIESCGVPHTEVDVIIVGGKSVDFSYRVADGDAISVYPVFESLDVSPIVRVRPEPLRETRFVADNHLGKLTRFLRLLGFDTIRDQRWDDPELVEISVGQRRILLTRDVELLKHGDLTHGYYVRSTEPRKQVIEVVRRFHLEEDVEPFTRCVNCNGLLVDANKEEVADQVPPGTRENIDEYRRCTVCGQVYWSGSHRPELDRIVDAAREAGGD
jgi:uncharacterized protein with PIN domain